MLASCCVDSPFSSPYGFRMSSLSMLLLRSAASTPLLLSPPPGGGFLLPFLGASSRGAEKPSILGGTDMIGENPVCLLGSAERDFLHVEQACDLLPLIVMMPAIGKESSSNAASTTRTSSSDHTSATRFTHSNLHARQGGQQGGGGMKAWSPVCRRGNRVAFGVEG